MSAPIFIRFLAHLVECWLLKPTSLLLERRPYSPSADVLFHFGWRVVYRLGWVGLFHMATHAHDVTRPPLPSVRSTFAWTPSLGGLCRLVLPVLPCPLFGTLAHVACLPSGPPIARSPLLFGPCPSFAGVACLFGRSASAVRPCSPSVRSLCGPCRLAVCAVWSRPCCLARCSVLLPMSRACRSGPPIAHSPFAVRSTPSFAGLPIRSGVPPLPSAHVVRSTPGAGGYTFVSPTARLSVSNLHLFGRSASAVRPCCPMPPALHRLSVFCVGSPNRTV
jgi:hypothetical protein